MRFEKQTFEHTEVTLDENEFVDWTIANCSVVFHGGRCRSLARALPAFNTCSWIPQYTPPDFWLAFVRTTHQRLKS